MTQILTDEQIAAAVAVAEAHYFTFHGTSLVMAAEKKKLAAATPEEFRAACEEMARAEAMRDFPACWEAERAWAAVRPEPPK